MDRARYEAFDRQLRIWEDCALKLADVAEAYRLAHAKAFNEAKGTDSARKAFAESETSAMRLTRDKLEIEERAAYHRTIALRGSAGEREER